MEKSYSGIGKDEEDERSNTSSNLNTKLETKLKTQVSFKRTISKVVGLLEEKIKIDEDEGDGNDVESSASSDMTASVEMITSNETPDLDKRLMSRKDSNRSSSRSFNPYSINIPTTVKHLGQLSFLDRSNICDLDLSNTNIQSIGNQAFYSNETLKSIKFPASLRTIGFKAFFECENLNIISFPTEKSVLSSIEAQAFYGCGITTLTFPKCLKSIADESFGNCTKLLSVFIPRNTVVHHNAFIGCNELPSFMLKNLQVREGQYSFCDFEEDKREVLYIEENEIVENRYRSNDTMQMAILLNDVKVIEASAFENCIALHSVELSKSIMSIGDAAFKGCSSLKEINLPERVTWISRELFSDCVSLEHISLSPQTKYICEGGFENCISLKDIEIPGSVVEIQKETFKDCSSLKNVAIPSSVTSCGNALFEGCISLKKVEFGEDIEIDLIEERTFYNCNALKECKLPFSVKKIKSEAFSNCNSLLSIKINEGITVIDESAFIGCSSIEHIHFPSSVKKIGMRAFKNCTTLRYVKFVNPNIKIGRKAFKNCESLEKVEGLSNDDYTIKYLIEQKVFLGCKHLKTPIGNEIHLFAEGKCWKMCNSFPKNSHLWIKQALKEENERRNSSDASFVKNHNGYTAFQCAVRGGAPTEYLKILAGGLDKRGKTHLDNFAERYAMKKEEDFSEDELAFRIAENSKLLSSTPIGGEHYLDTFEMLLGSSMFDPRTVPEFIQDLNVKFEKRWFVAILILDLSMPIIRAMAFSYLANFLDSDSRTQGWAFTLVYISLLYLSLRELLQFKDGKVVYLTSIWNYIDLYIIMSVFISTIYMHQMYSKEESTDIERSFRNSLAIETFFVWMYAVLKLRVLSQQFAVFVSGIINIIYKLVPFLVISTLILSTFAQMYLILKIKTRKLDSFKDAIWLTYSEFLAFSGLFYEDDPELEDKIITGVFGFFVVVLLLNIVIAVATTAWEGVTKRGRDDFLLYRIKVFLEVQAFSKSTKIHGPKFLRKYHSLSPSENYDIMWGESKKFSDVLRRVSYKEGGLALVGRIFLTGVHLILGLFFGITWPRAIRKRLFSIDNQEAIAKKRNHLQTLLKETQKELEKKEKISTHIKENPKDEKIALADCFGLPSHFELKRNIRVLQERVEKHRRDLTNFKRWQKNHKM